jgi:hypothetical protein
MSECSGYCGQDCIAFEQDDPERASEYRDVEETLD